MPRQSALAGHIAPIVESLVLSVDDVHAIVQHVSAILSFVDLAVLFSFGWLLVPLARVMHSFVTSSVANKDKGFESSYAFIVADHLGQIARLALLVYACDVFVVAFEAVGYKAEIASKVFAKILYTSWLARRAQRFKRYLIGKILTKAPKNCDKIRLVDRILDGIVFALLFLKVLDYLSIETGVALGSIFAVGTTGGLIISLASQEVAKGVMSGIEMATSDRFYEGDNVHFGDGTQGYIVKMGFLRTKVRKYDSTVIDIPNTQLGGQRAINISRSKTCRVLTKLRFEYEDVQNIPKALENVKEEISKACPKLIANGKPFRAMISSFEQNYVEATVNCSFELPPTGEKFWANREEMFLAIDRASGASAADGTKHQAPTHTNMKIFAIIAAAAALAPGAAAQTTTAATASAPVLVDTPAMESASGTPTPAPFGFGGSFFGGSSGSPTVLECPEETAAVESCYGDEADMDLNEVMGAMACAMCGLTALGEDFMNLPSESEYCASWKPCVEESCPKECLGPMNDLQVCQIGWDCGAGSAGTIFVSLAASFLAVAVTFSLV